jgi:hypothetical protein
MQSCNLLQRRDFPVGLAGHFTIWYGGSPPMNIKLLPLLFCATGLAFGQARTDAPAAQNNATVEDLNVQAEPPMLGIHWARGFEPNARVTHDARTVFARRSANMTYHGGKILPNTVTQPIFWGTSWNTSPGDKITGMDSWYAGFGGSNYAKTSDEYTGSNGQVGSGNTAKAHVVDTSASTGGGSTSAILAEVCRKITSPDPNGNGYYPVYTDTPRGNAGYCAWHSAGTCGNTPVQFAFFFKLDGDGGCDPGDTSGLHSQGLAALANVSGHELSEARSDPASPGAWYDAWTFGAPLVSFSNGTQWKIQGEWSNAAYTAGTGYPNSSGLRGCLSGQ